MTERQDWAQLHARADLAHARFYITLAELRRNIAELSRSASELACAARSMASGGRVCGRTSQEILRSLSEARTMRLLRNAADYGLR